MNKSLTVIAILIIALLTGCDSDGVLSDAEEIARTSGSATQKASVGFDTLDIYRADGLALVWCVILRSKISHDAGRPVTLDSLLEKSIKYCETFPESSERAHINYYAGLARMERERYAQAIVDFANSLHTVSISDGLIEFMLSGAYRPPQS